MKTVAFIPLRKGSREVPNKNIKYLAGKPLYRWAVDEALLCHGIDEVVVATDYESLPDWPADSRIRLTGRSPESATDSASSELVILEFCSQLASNTIVVFIQATNPFVTRLDLAKGLQQMNLYDSVVSTVRQKRFLWESADGGWTPNYSLSNRPRRQDWDGFLVENGAFYISTSDAILSSRCRVSGSIGVVEMDERSYIEIDSLVDFGVAESLVALWHS